MSIILYATLWLACSVGATGFWFAYFQGRFPAIANEDRRRDLATGWLAGLMGGPLALVMVFFFSGFGEFGWRLR